MATREKSRARDILEKVGLILASMVFVLVALEFVVRAASDEIDTFTFKNFALSKLSLFQSAFPASYDPVLGWKPTPGYASTKNVWMTRVTIDDDGLRSNGTDGNIPGPPVLALGDSFMFGDEVNDEDSVPARLEAKLGRRVLNAGVFGYGIDQAVLRGERLIDVYNPTDVILMIVPEDVWRTMLIKRSGVEKPYFDLRDGQIVLTNVPVSAERPSINDVGLGRKIFGYSYLVDWTFRYLNRAHEWYIGDFPEIYVHDDRERAQQISCQLIQRLAKKLRDKNIRGIITSAYSRPATQMLPTHEWLQPTQRMLRCGADAGMIAFDTHPAFKAIHDKNPAESATLFVRGVGHITRKGNQLIADRLFELLEQGRAK